MRKAWVPVLLTILAVVGFGCNKDLKDPDSELKYSGPLIENKNVTTLYSDSAKVLVKLEAPVQQEFDDGNSVYPDGLYVEFYEQKPGEISSTLRANYGKQERNKSLYLARGNVVVENIIKKEKLETEELYWDQRKGDIYTDKFVKITTPERILMGNGLKAKQDFSDYVILNPTGTFDLKQQ
ncbi:LPS export ABC transporter periplasmic protein LptC [Pontibacter harenae]|uniref:LPS export ABC transporter periplasmic protein LptC n=1 Tax=Pontibacter harenae TaxID=2894083 RepID=UPI001E4FC5DC|nr:LPS export ABC transporter periplasmic protein LptC [Pontibacter harenae]MCC9165327.1 LPS export ABC transporter periplasmic protein LptC [Pontibacter harenae]